MKPVSRARHVATAEVGEATESFLGVLRSEQFRYLDSVAAANEMLKHEPGRVALIAAIQNRLTQQFFDAQRSIIMRQAVYDTEVGRIEARAESDVDGIVAAARSRIRALAAAGRPLAAPHGAPVHDAPAPEPGVALARRTKEALADLPSAAFEAIEPDPDSIQRQLGALLDQWWSVLNKDGQAQIDHAHARAAMRRHVAAIESGIVEIPNPAAPHPTSTSTAASAAHLPQRAAALPSPVSSVASMAPTTITSPPSQQPVVAAPSGPIPALRPPAATIAASSFAAPVVPDVVVAGPAVAAPTASGRPAVSPARRPDASLPAPALGRAVPMTHRPAATIAIDLPARLVQAIEAAPIDDLRSLLETLDQHLRAARPPMPDSVGARPSIAVGPMPAPLSMPAMPAIPAIPAISAISSPQPTRPTQPTRPPVVPVPPVQRSTSTAVERASNDLVIRDEPAGSKSLARLDSIDTGAVMGGQAGSSDGTRRTLTLDKLSTVIPVRIVMPMVAATSAIALVMALVG